MVYCYQLVTYLWVRNSLHLMNRLLLQTQIYLFLQISRLVKILVNSNDYQKAIGIPSNITPNAFPTPDYCSGDTFTDRFNCALFPA